MNENFGWRSVFPQPPLSRRRPRSKPLPVEKELLNERHSRCRRELQRLLPRSPGKQQERAALVTVEPPVFNSLGADPQALWSQSRKPGRAKGLGQRALGENASALTGQQDGRARPSHYTCASSSQPQRLAECLPLTGAVPPRRSHKKGTPPCSGS